MMYYKKGIILTFYNFFWVWFFLRFQFDFKMFYSYVISFFYCVLISKMLCCFAFFTFMVIFNMFLHWDICWFDLSLRATVLLCLLQPKSRSSSPLVLQDKAPSGLICSADSPTPPINAGEVMHQCMRRFISASAFSLSSEEEPSCLWSVPVNYCHSEANYEHQQLLHTPYRSQH